MLLEQRVWTAKDGWITLPSSTSSFKPQLVLVFGNRKVLSEDWPYEQIRQFYPSGSIVCNSTAGEIIGTKVIDDSLVLTAIQLEKTSVRIAKISAKETDNDFSAGEFLARQLDQSDLCHIFVISDGHIVNGTELVRGLNTLHKGRVPITGGLAGDGPHFQKTLVGLDGKTDEGLIVAIGFYGNHLKVGHGSRGGWDPFGPERIVTKSQNNVLYELDHQSALQLYKKYLGPLSDELPSSALLFPLSIKIPAQQGILVRTVLSINEAEQSMTFAGDVPEGSTVQLMRANFERLVDGATAAAESSLQTMGSFVPELAILVSCVGRRLVLGERTEEEIEEVAKTMGVNTVLTGFYSYGEISPLLHSTTCELHNQTMTITTYYED